MEPSKIQRWKLVGGYILIIAVGAVLFSAAWGGVLGYIGGGVLAKLIADPSFQAEYLKIEETGDKAKMEYLINEHFETVKEQLKKVNWLPAHSIISFLTFSILGFLLGVILREYSFAGLVPLALLFVTLPVLTDENFLVKNKTVTVALNLSIQLASVYAFAYIGRSIRLRTMKSRLGT